MTNKNEVHPLSDYVQPQMAAKMLGVSRNRVYEYIRDQRLPAEKMGKTYFILTKDVERFQANPIGRTRTQPTSWRVYRSGGKLLTTEIDVRVRAGQQQRLVDKLQAMQTTDQHTFPGTIARYIVQGDEQLSSVHIILVWKTTDMPDEAARQEYLAAFQVELAGVLDWNTAHMQTNQAILHT